MASKVWTARMFAYGEGEEGSSELTNRMTTSCAYTIVTRPLDCLLEKVETIEKRVSDEAYGEALDTLKKCSAIIQSSVQLQNTPVLFKRQVETSDEIVNTPSCK